MNRFLLWVVALLLACTGTGNQAEGATAPGPDGGSGGGTTKLALSTPAFKHSAAVPKKFTADGPDVSPQLVWQGAPPRTQAWALIMDDPDAPVGTWVHWVVYDLPGTTTSLPEGIGKTAKLPVGTKEGTNSWGNSGWGGPSPPKGKPHRYFFKLYALSQLTGLAAGASKEELMAAMAGKILAEAQVMGTYGR